MDRQVTTGLKEAFLMPARDMMMSLAIDVVLDALVGSNEARIGAVDLEGRKLGEGNEIGRGEPFLRSVQSCPEAFPVRARYENDSGDEWDRFLLRSSFGT